MKKIITIALILLILAAGAAYYITDQQQKKQQAQETYKIVQQNLINLSKEYNKGIQKMYYLKKFEEAKNKIVKEPNK
jgi:hypothetical protein